ncbi:MAG: DUF1343 domain-containing protein [Thermoproteota archaeon]|nr:MAG: DUF1343 domain-containing protein [Candidatus Korarchaeota archaeon]
MRVKTGLEILFQKELGLIEGMKVGLITNYTAVNSKLIHLKDLLISKAKVDLVAIFAPEHGFWGSAQAGEYVQDEFDEETGVPIKSLYRPAVHAEGPEYVVDSIIAKEARAPLTESLEEVEALIFDIQDVGTRVYTYIWTMALSMEASAKLDKLYIVLDRPNPINGLTVEGYVLDVRFKSFVGMLPIPMRHGMTVGELALLFNEKHRIRADLRVIPMDGWERDMWFDQTGLPWIMPSPNLPTLDTALVYPGMVLFEGTNVSEGRGTTRPFETIGAPWIDGRNLANKLNELNLSGVLFREVRFVPTFSKYAGVECKGVQLHVIDRESFKPFLVAICMLGEMLKENFDEFEWIKRPGREKGYYFDCLAGTDKIRKALEEGSDPFELYKEAQASAQEFRIEKEEYLLY